MIIDINFRFFFIITAFSHTKKKDLEMRLIHLLTVIIKRKVAEKIILPYAQRKQVGKRSQRSIIQFRINVAYSLQKPISDEMKTLEFVMKETIIDFLYQLPWITSMR